jgi:Na+/H+-dicarboxylate symporter
LATGSRNWQPIDQFFQLRSFDSLSVGSLVAVSVTATFASVGAASIPQGGLVTIVMVLDVLGLPSSDVSISNGLITRLGQSYKTF